MGAIDKFLQRFGYAKLDRYGLVLTPDDRVLSARPAVLDDGLGGKIVGWVDGDLAAMELDRWGAAAKPAPANPVAANKTSQSARLTGPAPTVAAVAPKRVTPPPAPPTAPKPMLATGSAPVVAPVAAPIVMPVPAPVVTPNVAAEPVVEEDDWEWTIAMARARAAADMVSSAAASISAVPQPLPSSEPTRPTDSLAAAAEAAEEDWDAVVAAARAIADKPSVKQTERPTVKSLDQPKSTVLGMAPVSASRPTTPSGPRSTVIPVPQLPVAARPSDVRPAPYTPSHSPRSRIARGTGREDTVQTAAIAPANDDRTSPYITIPDEVKSVGYAHTKRVAAKQR